MATQHLVTSQQQAVVEVETIQTVHQVYLADPVAVEPQTQEDLAVQVHKVRAVAAQVMVTRAATVTHHQAVVEAAVAVALAVVVQTAEPMVTITKVALVARVDQIQ